MSLRQPEEQNGAQPTQRSDDLAVPCAGLTKLRKTLVDEGCGEVADIHSPTLQKRTVFNREGRHNRHTLAICRNLFVAKLLIGPDSAISTTFFSADGLVAVWDHENLSISLSSMYKPCPMPGEGPKG